MAKILNMDFANIFSYWKEVLLSLKSWNKRWRSPYLFLRYSCRKCSLKFIRLLRVGFSSQLLRESNRMKFRLQKVRTPCIPYDFWVRTGTRFKTACRSCRWKVEESIEKYGFMEFTSGYHSQDYDVKFPLRFSSINFILIIFLQKPREGGGYLG